MIPLIVGIVLILLALFFVFLVTRARRARSGLVRWPVSVLAAVLAIGFALVGVVDLRGVYTLNAIHANPLNPVKVSATSDQVARGQHLANFCAFCHSTTTALPLDGGAASMVSSPNGSGLGILYAPNLTPGGPLKEWSDGEILRAIREGVDKDGHALIIMPSDAFRSMSDSDVQAVVAYLRSQPAVARTTPPRDFNLIGTLLLGAGLFPTAVQPPITGPVTGPTPAVSADYGGYLVSLSGCRQCHGVDLAGGSPGRGPPPGPNLTLIVPKWSEDQFVQTIRTGKDPIGYSLRPDMMPWKQFSAAFTDDELKAVYAFLHALPPIQRPPG